MRWIGAAGILILVSMVWIKRNYRREFVQRHRKEFGWRMPIASCMLWIADRWSRGEPGKREEKYAQAVYVRNQPRVHRDLHAARAFGNAWCALMLGFLVIIGADVVSSEKTVQPEQGITRPEFGQEEEYTFQVDGLTGQTEEITVTVEGRQPGEEVMAEVFDDIMEKTKTQMVGDNPSLDEVRSDLELPTVSDYGVRLEWKSSDSELINDWGEIQREAVMETVGEEGKLVSFSVRMTYASYESNYEIHVRLMPPVKDDEYWKEMLMANINKKEKETIQDSVFYLPDQLEQRPLHYEQKRENSGWEYLVLTLAAAALLIWAGHEKMKKEFERREEQIQRDYPRVLEKMGILLRAGMTIRGAWQRMVEEYEERIERDPRRKRYVYEEMFVTWNQIRNGRPEGQAYTEFGRRCGTYPYIKFGNILEQNLKQGIAGISRALEREMTDALEARKNLALKRGEEAQTKLLLPMFLMLGIVLVILLVPAFLSF